MEEAMQLKLKRSQRAGGMLGGKIIFGLDARAALSDEEKSLVAKYSMGGVTLYNSAARNRHLEALGEASSAISAGSTGLLSGTMRALGGVALASMSLQITVRSLQQGQHIECKDLDELLGAETAIVDACRNLKTYLDVAQTFDGREEVVEF
jgi:hypothetical protein